ncbi:MAG: hypothetical protein FJ091_13725 [Deltaproteobacteria bacterium]|nr:hypothetical protein [Deltaproteobacteria bacterium]
MKAIAALALASFLLLGAGASATTLSFGTCVSNNNAGNCAIGSAQLAVSVASTGPNQVSFTFTNVGPSASSITDIYFDDGTLLGIASISSSAGVSFSQGASPGNLPAGNNASPAFVATVGFTADSDPPVQPNGVNPGESVTIYFDLQAGGTLQDVLDELADGRLRIGVHVQGYANGGSESLVNTPLPEPGTLALLTLSSVGLLRAGKRRA